MPRKRKPTQSGDPGQRIKSVPGQRYGEGVEQQAMQRNLPAPDRIKADETQMAAASPASTGPVIDQSVVAAPAEIGSFLAQHNPNLLATSQRPDEPLTAGLPFGPGAGAQPMSTTPIARYLAQLSRDTGNMRWKRLAEDAGL